MRNDDALATILLTSRLCADGVQPLKTSEYRKLCKQLGAPGVLLGQAESDLSAGVGLGAELSERIVRLLDRATAMAVELEDLEQSGIRTLTPFDDRYPERFTTQLRSKAPPVLYAAGDMGLLSRDGVGIVGSRDVDAAGAKVAKDAATLAARLGRVLVSGSASGVDQLAMNAAFEADGAVVGILAESLLRKVKEPDVRRAIYEERAVMCTPYNPGAPFSVWQAMARNKLIYALAQVTLVVASDVDKGGTWEGAVEALKTKVGRVAVWSKQGSKGPGNEALIERGGEPVESMEELEALIERGGEPVESMEDLEDIEDSEDPIEDPEAGSVEPEPPSQESLFVPATPG